MNAEIYERLRMLANAAFAVRFVQSRMARMVVKKLLGKYTHINEETDPHEKDK
jgi:hypothetical protein